MRVNIKILIGVIVGVIALVAGFYMLPRRLVPRGSPYAKFLRRHIPDILLVVVIFLMFIVYTKDIKWDLDTKPPQHMAAEITVEAMTHPAVKPRPGSSGFCQTYQHKFAELEEKCGELTDANCAAVDCCVLHKGKCVAGNRRTGPKYG